MRTCLKHIDESYFIQQNERNADVNDDTFGQSRERTPV